MLLALLSILVLLFLFQIILEFKSGVSTNNSNFSKDTTINLIIKLNNNLFCTNKKLDLLFKLEKDIKIISDLLDKLTNENKEMRKIIENNHFEVCNRIGITNSKIMNITKQNLTVSDNN